jgi:type II secretory pathway pseudopilin PulG
MRRRSHETRARREHGYIMLTLQLSIALLAIFAAAIVPTIAFDIKRDREEEMIHRGVQYSRAIRAYYKKFGRYPVKLEDLENTNSQRFLRKRYKDPLNCKESKCADFKLLHFGEVQMTLSAMGGGVIPGATPAGAVGSSPTSPFGGSGGGVTNSNSPFGQSAQTGTDPSQQGSDTSSTGTGDASNPSATGTGTGTGSNQIGSGQIIGGPIVGVASATKIKDSTIREFNHKKKHKDWAFVYDPAQDQGRLITTPYQPQLATFGQPGAPNLNGQNGSNGQPGSNSGFGNSSFGNSTGFGSSSSGFGNNSNSSSSGSFSQPAPPPSNPPQQQ